MIISMRTIILFIALSLDGYIAKNDGNVDGFPVMAPLDMTSFTNPLIP